MTEEHEEIVLLKQELELKAALLKTKEQQCKIAVEGWMKAECDIRTADFMDNSYNCYHSCPRSLKGTDFCDSIVQMVSDKVCEDCIVCEEYCLRSPELLVGNYKELEERNKKLAKDRNSKDKELKKARKELRETENKAAILIAAKDKELDDYSKALDLANDIIQSNGGEFLELNERIRCLIRNLKQAECEVFILEKNPMCENCDRDSDSWCQQVLDKVKKESEDGEDDK